MWIYLKIFPTCPRLSDWTSGLVLTEPPFTTFPACKKKETPILNCTQLYKIAKVKSKIKWNLTAFFFFFTLTSPFSPTLVLKFNFKDMLKYHWTQQGQQQSALEGKHWCLQGRDAIRWRHSKPCRWGVRGSRTTCRQQSTALKQISGTL